jgi:dTDP-4-dehydrorhamnose reductase
MRVTIFGASGLLGRALMREWSGDDVAGLNSQDADIRDAGQVQSAIQKTQPQWIVLAAAFTDVDGAESNANRAWSVNRDGAVNVARAAKQAGARLVFLSSDYVFDGKKKSPYETEDPRNPQGVYARSKAEAETRLLDVLPGVCIARTSWLFGVGGRCFPDTILKLAASRPALDVVDDQRGCPTYCTDLARGIIALCRKRVSGIVHITNAGDCSWFEFARAIVNESGLTTEIRPVSTEQMPRPAPRPAYSVLSAKSLESWDVKMPSWQDALQRYLKERSTS